MLQKQPINIAFGAGLSQKVDPWHLPPGNFRRMVNAVFQKAGRLQKRNGYGRLATLAADAYSFLTTLNGNLTAIGNELSAYNLGLNKWFRQGPMQPMSVKTLPLIRNSLNQSQCDSVTAPNGLVCVVYTEQNAGVSEYRYAILDSITGQMVVEPSPIPVTSGTVSGSLRVFLVGSYFVIGFTNLISATNHLQYIAIPFANPVNVSANTDIAANYSPAPGVSWDGVVINNSWYVAYNTSSGGQSVKVTFLTEQIIASSFTGSPISPAVATSFSLAKADIISLCADITLSNPIVYISYYSATSGFNVASVFLDLTVNFNPVSLTLPAVLLNIASAAQDGFVTIFAEVLNAYGYDSAIPTHYIQKEVITSTGSVATAAFVAIRSVGLASKALINDGVIYFLAAYASPFQPTYFLINGSTSSAVVAGAQSPNVAAKLAYENGGGYLTTGLPGVSFNSGVAQVAYLFKDLVQASARAAQANSTQSVTSPVYSQTGINLGTFDFSRPGIVSVETAECLQISGGFMWQYDGVKPVEQNFFLWPDSVEVSIATTSLTPTADLTAGSAVLTNVSSTAGIGIGMTITGADIPGSTTVLATTSSTIVMSAAALVSHTTETVTVHGNIAAQPDGATNTDAYFVVAVYEWTDNKGLIHRSAPSVPVPITTTSTPTTYRFTYHVPTLRLTYKIESPVKLTIYRWSVAQQTYFEITSILYPVLNDVTVDYIDISDGQPDTAILGNTVLYTTGGVVENINAPASNIITMFDDRVWSLSAEDPNLWLFSKQIIEGTPVEMSDLLEYFVAPATAAQGPTGPITAGAPMDDKLISFKKNAIYYTNGVGPDNTGANSQYSQPIFVTSTVGCDNQDSIVFTDVGLMFQSDKGIWLLGRDLSTQYIGADVEDFNSARVLSAVGVPETNQVRFTLDSGVTLMYDYFFKQWGTFEGVPGVSSCVYQDLHTYINSSGVAFQETPGIYLDNGGNPVLMSFTTAWLKLAGIQGYQRAYFFYLLAEFLSPHWLQMGVAYDYNEAITQAPLIKPTNFSTPAGSGPSQNPAGQQSPAGGESSVERWRVFLQRQRCQAIQISLQEVYDATAGGSPGAGFTLSGLQVIAGIKSGYRPTSARHSNGG